MTTCTAADGQIPRSGAEALTTATGVPLPVVRMPMLDRDEELFAYELVFYRQGAAADSDAALGDCIVAHLNDGGINRLVRGNRAFMRLSRSMLLGVVDALPHNPRLGVIVDPFQMRDIALMQRLKQLAERHCPLLLELGSHGPDCGQAHASFESILRLASFVRLDAGVLDAETLATRCRQLYDKGLGVIAGNVDDHRTYERCEDLPFQAIQGRYLLVPKQIEAPVLTPERLSVLRLMNAVQESAADPAGVGEIIRKDAVLSHKLLGGVNSAHFASPQPIKSIEHAAIFFGHSRMRNWINTLSLSGMADRPPELLRTALIRGRMCEKLAHHMPAEQQSMAFMAGLLSLLDALFCAPMEFVLGHLSLAPEIRQALVEGGGPFAPLLQQVCAWEADKLQPDQVPLRTMREMASIYFEAAQWADHVYALDEQLAA